MAKKTEKRPSKTKTQTVDEFLAALEHPFKSEIEALRAIILGVDPRIEESIKWNAPSYSTTDHFATMKLFPTKNLQLVLHTGAKVKAPAKALKIRDPNSILKWAAPDRCVVTFTDLSDLKSKADVLIAILREWIGNLEAAS